MLNLSHLSFSYDGSRILRDVSMQLPAGQVVALMGRNGVGKTTTLKNLIGLLTPDEGTIELEGQSLDGMSPHQRSRIGLAYVPQGRDVFPHLTVWENLQLSRVIHRGQSQDHLDRILQLFPVLKDMMTRKGGVLSGGQQQQLAIARALLTQPKVLLLDEPTEGIQPNIIDLIGETLLKIKSEGKISILLVEQYLDFCRTVADRFFIMDRGAVVASGGISELSDGLVKQHLTV